MKKPNLPQGDWNVSKHATPEGIHQFGIYAGDSPNDFVIVKGEQPIADAIAALPDLLATLEQCLLFVTAAPHDPAFHDRIIAALTKAGYTF